MINYIFCYLILCIEYIRINNSIVIRLRQIISVFHQIFIPTTFLQNIISIFNQIFESLSLS